MENETKRGRNDVPIVLDEFKTLWLIFYSNYADRQTLYVPYFKALYVWKNNCVFH